MRSAWQYLFLLAAVSFSALADPTPVDPEILIDVGFDSSDLSTHINDVQPDGTTSSIPFFFFNDTGAIVTSLTFDTTIKTGLSTDQIASGFGCPSPAHQGYFLSCDTPYDPTTGQLQYRFFGVNPADGDENFPIDHDTQFGEFEGIPIGGHFKITLAGWTTDAAAGDNTPLFDSVPVFENSFTTATPEPSQLLLLAVASLLLVGIAGIIRRREKRKEESIPTA